MDIKPVGSLYGSQYQLGNYDQCLSSWPVTPQLRTQYCLADIKIERKSHTEYCPADIKIEEKSHKRRQREVRPMLDSCGVAEDYLQTPTDFGQDLNLITWGVCVPASCHQQSVQIFVKKLLKLSHFGAVTNEAAISIDPCQEADMDQRYSFGDYLFLGLVACLLFVTTVSSLICHRTRDSKTNLRSIKITSCFSVSKNFKKLTDTNDQELGVLNGIRFLTSTLIIGVHYLLFYVNTAFSNGLELQKLLNMTYNSWLLRSEVLVDTFIMCSGLLYVTTTMSTRNINSRNLIKQLVKRYFRLVSTLAVILFFMTTVIQYTGSGPLWPKAVNKEVNACKRNWWLSLLMLNNYIDKENMCYPVLWNVYCDFQLAVVGTTLVYLYNKSRRAGLLIFVSVFIVSLVSPGVYTALYQLPPMFQVRFPVITDYRNDLVFKEMYIASHNRLAAYLVGMMFGYVLYFYKPNDFKKNISSYWSTIGASAALGLMLGILGVGASYYEREYSTAEAVLYAALHKPLWAFAVGLIVLCCVYGNMPLVNGFLTWPALRPLSRLSYGVYLVNGLVIWNLSLSIRSPAHFRYLNLLTGASGVLVISYLISLVMFLCVEAPAANLLNILLAKK